MWPVSEPVPSTALGRWNAGGDDCAAAPRPYTVPPGREASAGREAAGAPPNDVGAAAGAAPGHSTGCAGSDCGAPVVGRDACELAGGALVGGGGGVPGVFWMTEAGHAGRAVPGPETGACEAAEACWLPPHSGCCGLPAGGALGGGDHGAPGAALSVDGGFGGGDQGAAPPAGGALGGGDHGAALPAGGALGGGDQGAALDAPLSDAGVLHSGAGPPLLGVLLLGGAPLGAPARGVPAPGEPYCCTPLDGVV
ncbi:hypothetical protein Val02_41950 [Virgisporangium aliadipatigenens]|uniref:Uncharacterized protein n=1 Tax=Virgisporangium aliadipatigenens TaxID=741659 RepID=A0A8J3YKV0_9ACTN|nr:hypothetical protein [Virgisporangium aliadipatigenens]GIJ47309.1 hypothetical protein Val02_41950 [Virgisporangium aliadipatigenens]